MSHNPDATRRIENRTFIPSELLEEHKSDQEFAEYIKFPDDEIDIEKVPPVMAPESTQEVPRSGSLSNLSAGEIALLSTSLNLAVDLMRSKNEEIDALKSQLSSLLNGTIRIILIDLRGRLSKKLLPERDSAITDAQVVAWTQGYNDGVRESLAYINKLLEDG